MILAVSGVPVERRRPWIRQARLALAVLLGCFLAWQVILDNLPYMLGGNDDGSTPLLSGSAAEAETKEAVRLLRTDPALAAHHARDALAEAPLNQRALTVLALSDRSRVQLLGLSAALGWRDPTTQLALAQSALSSGNPTQFAQRIDAYARMTTRPGRPPVFIDRYITDPAIRSAVAARLALSPEWREAYVDYILDADPAVIAARRALLAQLRATSAPPTRAETYAYVGRLLDLKQTGEARLVWRNFAASPEAWSGLLYDGRFQQLASDSETPPFQWTVVPLTGAFVAVEPSPHGTSLHAHLDGSASGPVLVQQVDLPPGRYLLSTSAEPYDGAAQREGPSGFDWAIVCADDETVFGGPANGEDGAIATGKHSLAFTIPPGCSDARIAIEARGDLVDGVHDLWITGARIDPLLSAGPPPQT